ncbi:uncharacterized protein CEXT_613651 [Caerostris extrusa]|uniref:Uncharacterized protein n=1 Tax=Caerostris extrusa TaxID=172846 RepID=A0AAV4XY49_CAEEX|nr:uncharacterized protein CEXT_613651 [Caerostris extrusa]
MHGSSGGHTGQCLSACPSSGDAEVPRTIPYPNTSDRFLVVGSFSDTSGVAEGSIIPTVGPVTILRIHIDEEVDHWVALSEVNHSRSCPDAGTHGVRLQHQLHLRSPYSWNGKRIAIKSGDIKLYRGDTSGRECFDEMEDWVCFIVARVQTHYEPPSPVLCNISVHFAATPIKKKFNYVLRLFFTIRIHALLSYFCDILY